MSYRAPLDEIRFVLDEVLGIWSGPEALSAAERFAELDAESSAAILGEAGKIAEETLAPLRRGSDLQGAVLENGVVRTSPGFKEAYKVLAEGGWTCVSAPADHGGMGLPIALQSGVNEIFAGACMALSLCPLLTQGQIEALEAHGSEELKALYLPKLISGEWTGSMNLTEPQAGTDLAALRTRAERNGDGTYSLTGQKIWISWGDHDVAENVSHLVLARLPDAPPGVKGISLFLAPKFIPNPDGSLGERNALQVISLDHKMGLHGSPTCVMAYEGAKGWLVGEENKGLAAMFTMMNNARLGVGLEGVGIAEAAMQHAEAFARERVQGQAVIPEGAVRTGTIADHPDVRRMLLTMRAKTESARAIAYDCARALDLAKTAASPEERARWAAWAGLLTPLAKAYGTDVGNEVSSLGIQVHGGMGFIEETGAAQYARDVRVTAIYEGTNGVQAADLVGRKLSSDEGAQALALTAAAFAEADALAEAGLGDMARGLAQAASAAEEATRWMLDRPAVDRLAGSSAYLGLMSLAHGGALLGKGARLLSAPGFSGDAAFKARKIATARFFLTVLAAEAPARAAQAMSGAALLYEAGA
ncbi:acyl-CoA dehydrogenase [Neomegalonema sp.]|uniref:acyl-CoA dehydrogenase n=1 Tax=Neomegalonema sp. TaxID=2039713 RepID=UPI002606FF01|nr:acyl-CoA dehydrogenase [Neomegalonema sp.]MDD2870280.1 acyl-CoA dehydrogenase family protein [Neomegalonema sp.]